MGRLAPILLLRFRNLQAWPSSPFWRLVFYRADIEGNRDDALSRIIDGVEVVTFLTYNHDKLDSLHEVKMSISQDEPTTKLTYDDYVLFPCDGNRHEIIHGRHYVNPAPSPRHQFVSRHLQFQLFQQIELQGLGQVINAPIDLQLSDTDVVQPDIVVVLNARRIITTTKIKGIPDLVIEILSPSTREYDQQLKKQLYEQSQVPEYWIVDSDEQSIQQCLLGDSEKYSTSTCSDTIRFEAANVSVNLTKVW